jgi:syringate O-demethylase/vanillate/3-O-methylgallate O-demethylase
MVGISTYVGYLFADRAWVSLAVVDEKDAELGRELTVIWGEERGGGQRPLVEKHKQMEVRATVAAWPFSKLAQEGYRKVPG